MTEEEWFATAQKVASPRKFQLFMAGCCRRGWGYYGLPIVSQVIEAVEGNADGTVTDEELEQLRLSVRGRWLWGIPSGTLLDRAAQASSAVREFLRALNSTTPTELAPREQAARSALLREVIGDPFEPVQLEPEWFTSAVVQIARQMYESREFGNMPILADALEDGGCDVEDVLNHCRDPQQVHVRGCWVVDLVLGKA